MVFSDPLPPIKGGGGKKKRKDKKKKAAAGAAEEKESDKGPMLDSKTITLNIKRFISDKIMRQ